jgi:hypothetical protein
LETSSFADLACFTLYNDSFGHFGIAISIIGLAIVKLKMCIYECNKTDEANLLLALETGTLARDGHRYSPEEIIS